MEKLSSFFIGVVDFFAALLPGCATIAVLLVLAPDDWQAFVDERVSSDEAGIAAFIAAGYVVGQVMNAIGSYALDVIYDGFYAPDHGLFVGVSGARGWRGRVARVAKWKFPLGKFISGLVETDTGRRAETLGEELDRMAGKSPSRGAYARIRAYFSLALPSAFEQVERLESEQKFFRTATVAMLIIAGVVTHQGHDSWWMWLLAGFLFTRYVSRRRKTIERAYMFFGLRSVARTSVGPKSFESMRRTRMSD